MFNRKYIITSILILLLPFLTLCGETETIEKKHKKLYKKGDDIDLVQLLELSKYEGGVLQEVTIHYNMLRSELEVDWLVNGVAVSQASLPKGFRKKSSYNFQQVIDSSTLFEVRFAGPKGFIQLSKITAEIETSRKEPYPEEGAQSPPEKDESQQQTEGEPGIVYDKKIPTMMFDFLSNFKIISMSNTQLIFSVDFSFNNHQQRGDVAIVITLDDKILPAGFSYKPTIGGKPLNVLKENGQGTITFEVNYKSRSTVSYKSSTVTVGMFRLNDPQKNWFLKQNFKHQQTWTAMEMKGPIQPPLTTQPSQPGLELSIKQQPTDKKPTLFIPPKLEMGPMVTTYASYLPPFLKYGFDDLKKANYSGTPILLVIEPRKPLPTKEDRVQASSPNSVGKILSEGLGGLGDIFSGMTDDMMSEIAEHLSGGKKDRMSSIMGKYKDAFKGLLGSLKSGDSDVARFIRGERRVVPWAFIFFVRSNEGHYAKLLIKVNDDTDDLMILDYVLYDYNGQVLDKSLQPETIWRSFIFDVERGGLGPLASKSSADLHWRWMLVPKSARVGGYLQPINNAQICFAGVQQVISY